MTNIIGKILRNKCFIIGMIVLIFLTIPLYKFETLKSVELLACYKSSVNFSLCFLCISNLKFRNVATILI